MLPLIKAKMARLIPNGGYHGTSQAVAVNKSGSFARQNSAYTLRIAVLGDCGVGKTTLIHHLITGQFRNQLSLSLISKSLSISVYRSKTWNIR